MNLIGLRLGLEIAKGAERGREQCDRRRDLLRTALQAIVEDARRRVRRRFCEGANAIGRDAVAQHRRAASASPSAGC